MVVVVATGFASCSTDEPPPFRSANPAARSGGTLRIGTTQPGSIDPGNVYEPAGELVARTLCTPLLATDPETSELMPAVVESWLVTDGGAGLTLRLREGVRFSDGTPLDAEDVVFTFTRIASAEYASTSAERLSPIIGYPELHGDAATDDDSARRRLVGVELRDERTVQISLSSPQADFVRLLASPLTAPVSEAAATSDPIAFARRPVCVGPYSLEAPYAPGDASLRLIRSETYDAVDTSRSGGGQGYADTVEFRFYPDPEAAAVARLAGEVDLAPARPQDEDDVESQPGPEVEYVGLPTTTPGFDNALVRRALSLALDRSTLAATVFPSTRIPADGFLPPTSPDEDECAMAPPDGDVAAARSSLAEAGIDLGQLRVPIYFNDEGRHRQLVTEVARQWQDAFGLTAVPTPLAFGDFVARGEATPGFDGPFRFSWYMPYPDADGYLFPLFSTGRIGRDNFSRFSDPAIDEALAREARRAQDPADRRVAYRHVTQLLCQAMPMIPLTTSLSRWGFSARVGSATDRFLDGSTGQPLVRELYLR